MIVQPEQYEINKMTKGDLIYVINRPMWYKLLRKYILTNKEQVKVKTNWDTDNSYNLYYKEDCILIYNYELKCSETFNNQPDYYITKSEKSTPVKNTLKSMTVNLYNLQLVFKNDTSITIPLDKIKQGIRDTEQLLKEINRQEIVESQIKFMRYKGDYFKQLIYSNNIKHLNIMYCSICGKSTVFNFKKDHIDVINKCECGNTTIDLTRLTYDEFAVWYASQTDGNFKKHIDNQLFISKES